MPRSPQRVPAARRWRVGAPLVFCVALATAGPAVAVESGPQGVVRQFCQADALGRRVNLRGWPDFIPLISWQFEPAWDYVVLITGYTVDSPRPVDGGALEIEVHYDVLGQVSALGFEPGVHTERVTFRVHAPEQGWRITGPPTPPHIFASRVDVELMRRSFELGALSFLPNSLFVSQMFRSAGWNVPFQRTADLLVGTAFRAVDTPRAGDVVVYQRDGEAYHVGLLEAENQVVSSTLNAGIVRAAVDAFAGEVRYLRLIEPDPEPTPAPALAMPTRRAAPATPGAVKKPAVKQPAVKAAKPRLQPATRGHVATTRKGAPTPSRRTPAARSPSP